MEIRAFAVRLFALAALVAALQACILGGGKDDTNIKPKPQARKPNAPTVTYAEDDSLLHIRIRSTRSGEEDWYWIYRDETLLDQPAYFGPDSANGVYYLVDSVAKPGEYSYTVKYGPHKDSLSEPTKPYVFKYTGPSKSGRVLLEATALGTVVVNHRPGRTALRQVIIQRKVGAEGTVRALDTLDLSFGDPAGLLDTALILDDVHLYYRAVGMDLDENWLDPSPWDSILVKNKDWTYLPAASLKNQGTEIEVHVINPFEDMNRISYVLYRNTRSAKDGAVAVDTTISGGDGILLYDVPAKEGTYWYWVVARDSRGRVSARSNPASTIFTGRPKGPAITSLSTTDTYVQIYYESLQSSVVSLILERTQDTTKAPTAVRKDTLFSFNTALIDRPPKDGFWHYRLIAVHQDGKLSDPGDWHRSGYFSYRPFYYDLPARITNLGDHIQASPSSPVSNITYVLYRSSHPAGRDSIAVDTLFYPSWSPTGPVLKDTPAAGTWYYRLFGTRQEGGLVYEYRSDLLRVDFTGKAAGPELTQAYVYSTYIALSFMGVEGAIAYVIERAPDSGNAWTAIDTLSASGQAEGVAYNDRPATDGYFRYRVRYYKKDLTLSDPGPARRTTAAWSDQLIYSNTLEATISNGGTFVEATGLRPEFQFVHILYRGPRNDYSGGIGVDTVAYGETQRLRDTPAKGTYYYWVERRYANPDITPGTIYRSVPVQVEFTGNPELVSVTQQGQAVKITLPSYADGDTLEILRSAGKADDESSFEKIAEATGGVGDYYIDTGLDLGKAAFYHYRVVLIHQGQRSQLGGVKSVYFSP